LWSEEAVSHAGEFYSTHELTIQPKPCQQPLPVWFGGRSQAAYKRVGRMGDGFLGSYQPPSEAGKAVRAIRSAAEAYKREVPEDHYGTIVPFHFGEGDLGAEIQTLMRRIDPNTPFESYAAWRQPDAILRRIDEYVEAGVTKFVLRPMVSGPAFYDQLAQLAELVVPRYHGD
jgi:alkanesulfonate monooxygenase SsuD/methylene tetrahydromethanopterin reductase-like flavin-dependent oxidoreductase (luciferase family)